MAVFDFVQGPLITLSPLGVANSLVLECKCFDIRLSGKCELVRGARCVVENIERTVGNWNIFHSKSPQRLKTVIIHQEGCNSRSS